MTPKTQYARSGDVSIAYQVSGDGPLDLVVVPGALSHLEHSWTEPAFARYFERLATFARVLRFDKRGTGMSDRDAGLPTLEDRMDDVRAVMDAAGSQRAAVFGSSEGAALAALFAASHPDRTIALVLYGACVRLLSAPDWPGIPSEVFEQTQALRQETFGEGLPLAVWAPSAATPERQAWWGTSERLAASPSAGRALIAMLRNIDVREILPTIRVPTLVVHRRDDLIIDVRAARLIAEAIPSTRFVELAGSDHLPMYGDVEALVGEIAEFLTGHRHAVEPDRVLATVAFTDIVGSTELAVKLGDAEWGMVLDRHDDCAQRKATEYAGRVVKTMGDGVLATFDGPARATRFAAALANELASTGLQLRAGVHTGEVELRGEDIGGVAVHIAARIAALAGAGEILVSRTVKDLTAGSGLVFEDRGAHRLKGIGDDWNLYRVANDGGRRRPSAP